MARSDYSFYYCVKKNSSFKFVLDRFFVSLLLQVILPNYNKGKNNFLQFMKVEENFNVYFRSLLTFSLIVLQT